MRNSDAATRSRFDAGSDTSAGTSIDAGSDTSADIRSDFKSRMLNISRLLRSNAEARVASAIQESPLRERHVAYFPRLHRNPQHRLR